MERILDQHGQFPIINSAEAEDGKAEDLIKNVSMLHYVIVSLSEAIDVIWTGLEAISSLPCTRKLEKSCLVSSNSLVISFV